MGQAAASWPGIFEKVKFSLVENTAVQLVAVQHLDPSAYEVGVRVIRENGGKRPRFRFPTSSGSPKFVHGSIEGTKAW